MKERKLNLLGGLPVFLSSTLSGDQPRFQANVYAANLISRRYIGALCLLRAVRTRSFTFYIYYTLNLKKNQI